MAGSRIEAIGTLDVAVQDLDRNKLAKVLALADSSSDGEALAALRRARGMLAEAGLEFRDLLTGGGRHFPDRRIPYLEALIRDLKERLAASEAEVEALRRAKLETTQDFARQVAALGHEKSELSDTLRHRIEDLKRRLAEAGRVARQRAGKRDAVIALLQDPETRDLSNRELARRAGVSPQTVSRWRRKLSEECEAGPALARSA